MKRSGLHQKRHVAAGRGDGWVCAFCGSEVQCRSCFPGTHAPATIDHIVPKSRGGSNALSNLQIACEPCNRDKADRKHPQNRRTSAEPSPYHPRNRARVQQLDEEAFGDG